MPFNFATCFIMADYVISLAEIMNVITNRKNLY